MKCQVSAEIFRLEIDDTLLNTDTEYSRQGLDALLMSCGMATSLEKGHKGTIQAEESFDSLALGPSLSPL